uniref:O-phosphoseryl-tRNA(Sec) selenium transferase n=1 Tax=Strigamia maritima TaxID=126957 RepID=T1ITR7_STRMM
MRDNMCTRRRGMDSECFNKLSKILPVSYVQQAENALRTRQKQIRILLEQKKLSESGWDDGVIELFLHEMAQLDSNNFQGNIGVGEREARIYSNLVAARHYRLGHGIGRSGDLVESQPKATGSSMLNVLANALVRDAIKLAGITSTEACFVAPIATGMALTLCMLYLRSKRPQARYVIWPRIDQKSCFKSILTAGFTPIIIENVLEGDELRTNIDEISCKIEELKSENVLCVLTTTSCFAPRAPDKLEEVAILCKTHSIPHVVNNAYGLQSTKCTHLIQQASRVGRVDAFVQSTDKNFMVPVGGAIIAGFDKNIIADISKMYPGRASASPSLDVFITLLSLGSAGYRKLLSERKNVFNYLRDELLKCCESNGEKLLHTPSNTISQAMTLTTLPQNDNDSVTKLGSMLYTRCVSGTRVVAPGLKKEISGTSFDHYGSHSKDSMPPYLTAAAAIGMTCSEVDIFIKKLNNVFSELKKN